MMENDFLISTMGLTRTHPHLRVPASYKRNNGTYSAGEFRYHTGTRNADTISVREIVQVYKGISRKVISDLYTSYYPDFVLFNYTIDEIWSVAGEDDPTMKEPREKVREYIIQTYGLYENRSDDMTCEGKLLKL